MPDEALQTRVFIRPTPIYIGCIKMHPLDKLLIKCAEIK